MKTPKTDDGTLLSSPSCSASSLYSDKLRSLIDGWLDGPILRNMGFGFQMEYVHGWLCGHPPHLTGVGHPINEGDAREIVFSYFHDPLAKFVLGGYDGGGGLVNSMPNAPAQTPATGASADTHINHQTT